MSSQVPVKFQIGKNGVTPGVISSLHLLFTKHKVARISTLKSSGRDRNSIKEIADDLVKKLTTKEHIFTYSIIGFTIIVKRRSAVNQQKAKSLPGKSL